MATKKYQPKTRDELKALCDDLSINLGDIDTSLITDMSELFCKSPRDDYSGIETWDTSKVECTASMFECSSFNHPIENWDVSSCRDMNRMFEHSYFNQPIEKWDVSNVVCMYALFRGSDFNQPLNSWNVSSVEDMSHMFEETRFNQPLDKWDVSKVKTMTRMFALSEFNQDISAWNIKNVQYMGEMFSSNIRFDQCLDWDISNVLVSDGVKEYVLRPIDFIDFKDKDFSLSEQDKEVITRVLKPAMKKYHNDRKKLSGEIRHHIDFVRDDEAKKYTLIVKGDQPYEIDVSSFFKKIYRKDLIVNCQTSEGEHLKINSNNILDEVKELSVFDLFNVFDEYPSRYKKCNANASIVFCGSYTYLVTIKGEEKLGTEVCVPALFFNFTYEIEKGLDYGLCPDWFRECFM